MAFDVKKLIGLKIVRQDFRKLKYLNTTCNGRVEVEHNTEIMRKIYQKLLGFRYSIEFGGAQSNRGRNANLMSQAKGEFPSENYGNTLEGTTQCISGFGDTDVRKNRRFMLYLTKKSILVF